VIYVVLGETPFTGYYGVRGDKVAAYVLKGLGQWYEACLCIKRLPSHSRWFAYVLKGYTPILFPQVLSPMY
jgi:hypothetical protein